MPELPTAMYTDAVAVLASRRVLIVGAGGLGCPASLVLARAGVGAITFADPDVVDPSNLHRQLWHRREDVGLPKVESAASRLAAAFPGTEISALRTRVDAGNAPSLFRASDAVVDGSDDVETKFCLSDAAVRTGTPLVYGGVLRMGGQVMAIAPGGPCLRCLFESAPDPSAVPSCAQAGVLGSVAGVIGAMQAQVALDCLREPSARVDGWSTLRVFDGHALRTRDVVVRRAPDCAVCAEGAVRPPRASGGAAWRNACPR